MFCPGRQSVIPGGVGGVSGRNPQSQTSFAHQQQSRCGFQVSGVSSQPLVVLWGLLRGSVEDSCASVLSVVILICGVSLLVGIESIGIGIGGVRFFKAKARL